MPDDSDLNISETVVETWAMSELAKRHPVVAIAAGGAIGGKFAIKVMAITFAVLLAGFFILAGIAKSLGY